MRIPGRCRDRRESHLPICRRTRNFNAADVDVVPFSCSCEDIVQDGARLRKRLRLKCEKDCCLNLHDHLSKSMKRWPTKYRSV
jgi:hypothetical protein